MDKTSGQGQLVSILLDWFKRSDDVSLDEMSFFKIFDDINSGIKKIYR